MGGADTVSASEKKSSIAVDRRPPDFTIEELVRQIASALAVTEEGMTTKELCESVRLPPTKANISKIGSRVHDMVVLGLAERVGIKGAIGIDGKTRPAPAWRLKSVGEDA